MKSTSRNAPCPCGSKAKYKFCCGRDASASRSTAVNVCAVMPIRDSITPYTRRALERDGFAPLTVVGKPVDTARNELVQMILAQNPVPDVVLWIDSDAWWPSETVQKLLRVLMLCTPEVDLAAAFTGVRAPNAPPIAVLSGVNEIVRPGVNCPEGAVVEVEFALLHFAMHRTSLLQRVGPDPFTVASGNEDGAFIARVRALGARVVSCTGLPVAQVEDDGTAYVPWQPQCRIIGDALLPEPEASFDASRLVRTYGPNVTHRSSNSGLLPGILDRGYGGRS